MIFGSLDVEILMKSDIWAWTQLAGGQSSRAAERSKIDPRGPCFADLEADQTREVVFDHLQGVTHAKIIEKALQG